jgi:hypothetical protein
MLPFVLCLSHLFPGLDMRLHKKVTGVWAKEPATKHASVAPKIPTSPSSRSRVYLLLAASSRRCCCCSHVRTNSSLVSRMNNKRGSLFCCCGCCCCCYDGCRVAPRIQYRYGMKTVVSTRVPWFFFPEFLSFPQTSPNPPCVFPRSVQLDQVELYRVVYTHRYRYSI